MIKQTAPKNLGKLPTIRMSRRISFSSAHLYHQAKWDNEKNHQVFGPCFSEHGHGHNYTLEVFFEGQIDPQTGLLVNLTDVNKALKDIIKPLDHQHLNFTLPEFQNKVPTTENIASYLVQKTRERFSEFKTMTLYKLRLSETEDLWVEVIL